MKSLIIIIGTVFYLCSLCVADEPLTNELPMYGGQHMPAVEQNREFSKSAARLGWDYYYKGDFDAAIKRFNQAWMFDRENVDALWGFGLIMGQRASKGNTERNLKESVRYLQMAYDRSQRNAQIIVDLAYSHTILGYFRETNKRSSGKEDFKKARELYLKAEKLEPKYPPLYSNWSVLEFYEGKYRQAKSRLDYAKKLGFKPDLEYEKDLDRKLKQ